MRISDWSSDVCSSDLNKVINDQVIDAMAALPREQFVPKPYRGVAYMDEDVAVAPGRFLMEPMVLARLLQEAELQPSDVALVVGAATGYDVAVLARIVNTVIGQIGRASWRERVCQYG